MGDGQAPLSCCIISIPACLRLAAPAGWERQEILDLGTRDRSGNTAKRGKGGRRVDIRYCKLEIFLPESHLEAVRRALERVDAGHIGRYDRCLSYSPVTSCWRPLPGTSPYLGEAGAVCTARELKVEVTCPVERVEETVAAVRAAHPYEEPVIQVIPLWGTGLAGEQKEGDSHGI